MASLALGVVGGYLFGPIGFMVGSAIGNLLFPPKVEGPRLSDLKLQNSQYGNMIPYVYGTMRISGQVIWQTDLVEHEHTEGGKGGPEVTTYTYTASFAVLLCNNQIAGILKIWADGTLIYDTSGEYDVDNSAVPITIYYGTEDQLPDPTMEADLGAGNVPAHRGNAYAVFTDWDLGRFGNRLPSLSFEVYTSAGTAPTRIATFYGFQAYTQNGVQGAYLENGVITIGEYYSNFPIRYKEHYYDLYGNPVDSPGGIDIIIDNLPTGQAQSSWFCANAPFMFGWHNPGAGELSTGWFYAGQLKTVVSIPGGAQYNPSGSNNPSNAAYGKGVYLNGFIYAFARGSGGVGTYLARWPVDDSTKVVSTFADKVVYIDANGASDHRVGQSDDGYVYVLYEGGVSTGTFTAFWKLTADLETVFTLTRDEVYSGINSAEFFVFQNMAVINCGPDGFETLRMFTLPDWQEVGQIDQKHPPFPGTGNVYLGGCYGIGEDGTYSVCPAINKVTLASIVADLSERAGLQGGSPGAEYDVTDLTDLVDGFFVTSRAEVRSDIEPLRSAYFFDAVESAGVVKFVKRGKPAVMTIVASDLAAHAFGSDAPPTVEITRVQEVDLPAQTDVSYFNIDASWQQGSQSARRQVTQSEAVSQINLPIAMNDATARQIASTNLISSWLERDKFTIWLPRSYALLEPTDVISVSNYVLRIEEKNETPEGVIELKGPRAPGIPTSTAVPGIIFYAGGNTGNATEGGTQTTPKPIQRTSLLLLDLPMVIDTDFGGYSPGYYIAAKGEDASWTGAVLYKSPDSGLTYNSVTTLSTPAIVGVTSNALGDFFGGNIFDELNVLTVVVGSADSLSSLSEQAVLNGGNMAVVGDELIQFKLATLVAANTYELTGLLRGRRGTEWAMGGHASAENFVMLPLPNAVDTMGEMYLPRYFKGVTRGSSVAATAAIIFTENGVAVKPYAPTELGGGPIYNGGSFDGTVQMAWTRRTRLGGAWVDYVDVPLGEGVEAYLIQIWNSSYTLCARNEVVTDVTTYTYTSAQQVTDFGANQQTIYFTVQQLGTLRVGTTAYGSVPGLGGSSGDPLNPITPIPLED